VQYTSSARKLGNDIWNVRGCRFSMGRALASLFCADSLAAGAADGVCAWRLIVNTGASNRLCILWRCCVGCLMLHDVRAG